MEPNVLLHLARENKQTREQGMRGGGEHALVSQRVSLGYSHPFAREASLHCLTIFTKLVAQFLRGILVLVTSVWSLIMRSKLTNGMQNICACMQAK